MLGLSGKSRGAKFVPKYKYALDSGNQTVYVLVTDAGDAESMTDRSFRVDGKHVSFSRVLKMEKRAKDDDFIALRFGLCDNIVFSNFPGSSYVPLDLMDDEDFCS